MLVKSSSERAGPPWHRTRIWWPVERIPVLLEIVHPRRLTALEWAVLRVVETFREDLPTLDEVAEELGIGDAAFLRDTLREVVRLRALAPRTTDAPWSDLPDLTFTTSGLELFRRGQIEAEPAHHGEDLYFDALTDEPRPAPSDAQDWTEAPFPRTIAAPQPRETVGLDRVRDVVRRFRPDLLEGDGEIRSIGPRLDAWPRVVWAPAELELRLSEDGRIEASSAALTGKALEYLASTDGFAEEVAPNRVCTVGWERADIPRRSSRMSHEAWRGVVSRTLPTDAVAKEVQRLVGTARRELFLHAGWYGVPSIRSALADVVRTGVRVFVVGADETEVPLLHESKTGLLVTCSSEQVLPACVVADGRVGLLLDDVVVTFGQARAAVELAGAMTQKACSEVRAQLMSAANAALSLPPGVARPVSAPRLTTNAEPSADADRLLNDAHLRVPLARLALLGEAREFGAVVRAASLLATGPERVALLVRVGAMGRALSPDLGEEQATAPALEAWRALLVQLADFGDAPHLPGVAALAPAGATAEEFILAALDRVASRAPSIAEGAEVLVRLRDAVDARWGRGSCRKLGAFATHRDRMLVGEPPLHRDRAERAAAARRLLDPNETRAWAAHELDTLAEPHDGVAIAEWIDQTKVLGELAPDVVRQRLEQHYGRLVASPSADVPAVIRSAAGGLDASTLFKGLLPSSPSVAQVLAARAMVTRARVAVDKPMVVRAIERALPDPSTVASTSMVSEEVATLGRVGMEDPAVLSVGRAWASRLVAALPDPEGPAALSWWLAELAPLRPLLDDPAARAAQQVRRFQSALRTAREQGDALWDQARHAWMELGLTEAQLAELLVVDRPAQQRPEQVGSKKRRKRR